MAGWLLWKREEGNIRVFFISRARVYLIVLDSDRLLAFFISFIVEFLFLRGFSFVISDNIVSNVAV